MPTYSRFFAQKSDKSKCMRIGLPKKCEITKSATLGYPKVGRSGVTKASRAATYLFLFSAVSADRIQNVAKLPTRFRVSSEGFTHFSNKVSLSL